MKLLTLTMLFLSMTYSTHIQDLVGNWSGSLNVQGTQLRLFLHVTKSDGKLKATLDSPDQKVDGIQITDLKFNDPNLRFEISTLGVVYEGVLAGNRISGKWMQSGQRFELAFTNAETR